MTDPETPSQPLLAAPNQQAATDVPGGRSSRPYKVAAITLLACVLIVSQAMIAYFLLSQRSDIKALQDQGSNLKSELTKGRSAGAPSRMHIPMSGMPVLTDFSVDEEASTEVPENNGPPQFTVCQLERSGLKAVPLPGFRPACDERGLYQVQQCFQNNCWCVNPVNGEQISGSLSQGRASCGPSALFTGRNSKLLEIN